MKLRSMMTATILALAGTCLFAQTAADLQAQLAQVRIQLAVATDLILNSPQVTELARAEGEAIRTYREAVATDPSIAPIDKNLRDLETQMSALISQRDALERQLTQAGGRLEDIRNTRDAATAALTAATETQEILDLQARETALIGAIRAAGNSN